MGQEATIPRHMLDALCAAGDAMQRSIEALHGRTDTTDAWAAAWADLHEWLVARKRKEKG